MQADEAGNDAGRSPAEPRQVKAVLHAIHALRALSGAPQGLSLSAIARKIGVSKPSAYHMLLTMESEHFVTRDQHGNFRLDWGVYEVGSTVVRSVDVVRAARFHLDRLAETTGEATLLAIEDGGSVLYLDRGQTTQSFHMIANVGRRSPLHTNASGKLLLAYMPSERIEAILSQPLPAKTPATFTKPEELRQELARIRERGFATCWQEQEVALNSIATPLTNYAGEICAALTIAGPSVRLTKRAVPRLTKLLMDEAAACSRELGAAQT